MRFECQTTQERIALSEPLGDAEQRHLRECADCRTYERDMEHLIGGLKDLPPVAVPAGLADRVMLAVEGGKRPASVNVIRRYAPVAAAVALVLVAYAVLKPGPEPAAREMTAYHPSAVYTDIEQAPPLEHPPIPAEEDPELLASSPDTPVSHAAAQESMPQPDRPVQPQAVRTVQQPPASEPAAQPETAGLLAVASFEETFGDASPDAIYYDPMAELVGF